MTGQYTKLTSQIEHSWWPYSLLAWSVNWVHEKNRVFKTKITYVSLLNGMYNGKRQWAGQLHSTNKCKCSSRENERPDYLQLWSISVRVSNAILEADANPCSRSIAQIAISKRRRLTAFVSAILNRLSSFPE